MTGNGKGSLPSFPETTAEPSQDAGSADLGFGQPRCCPRWTAAADFIILDRIGSVPYTLVETVPAGQSPKYAGTEVLDARDLHEGFSGGPRLDLIHLGEDGNDLEVSYFQIDGWDSYRGIGPTPDGLLVSLGQIAETSCHYSLTLRTHTCRHWGSIAAPTSFITGPPPAWSIRSSGASTETCNVILLGHRTRRPQRVRRGGVSNRSRLIARSAGARDLPSNGGSGSSLRLSDSAPFS